MLRQSFTDSDNAKKISRDQGHSRMMPTTFSAHARSGPTPNADRNFRDKALRLITQQVAPSKIPTIQKLSRNHQKSHEIL